MKQFFAFLVAWCFLSCGFLSGCVVATNHPDGGSHADKGYEYSYYPDASVYFDLSQKVYFYKDGSSWKKSGSLPARFKNKMGSPVELRVNSRKPYEFYDEHHAKYPSSKNSDDRGMNRQNTDKKIDREHNRSDNNHNMDRDGRRPGNDDDHDMNGNRRPNRGDRNQKGDDDGADRSGRDRWN